MDFITEYNQKAKEVNEAFLTILNFLSPKDVATLKRMVNTLDDMETLLWNNEDHFTSGTIDEASGFCTAFKQACNNLIKHQVPCPVLDVDCDGIGFTGDSRRHDDTES